MISIVKEVISITVIHFSCLADTSGGMVFLLSIITCGIYMLYWMYKAGEKVQAAQAKRGLPYDSNSGILYLILSLFGFSIVSYCLIQNELNKMATPHA